MAKAAAPRLSDKAALLTLENALELKPVFAHHAQAKSKEKVSP